MRWIALSLLAGIGCASVPSTELYPHPWPDERLRRADGTLDLTGFPSGNGSPIRDQALASLDEVDGFGVASPIFFAFGESLDAGTLPSLEESLSDNASVFVVNLERGERRFGERSPIDVAFLADAGPFGGTNLLVALPYPGIPLAPHTRYAFVVTTNVTYDSGEGLGALDASSPVLDELEGAGVTPTQVARVAVIRTGDPTAALASAAHQVQDEEPLTLTSPALVEEFSDYCVFHTTTEMPVYQAGIPPFEHRGGGWVQSRGQLVLQRREVANVWITVPRRPRARYPSAVLVRAGAGGDRPLVDRGPRDRDGFSAPGSGIARDLARVGYVGLSVDGPLGGLRNRSGWDEQITIFNVRNPIALRDNVRQSALELALFAHALGTLRFSAVDCEGAAAEVVLDPEPVLIAHSTGATIAPLAAGVEPRFSALILSGAGASYIRQVVFKESPAPMRPLAEMLFDYWPRRTLHEHDPLLGLLQWAGEQAEPMVYGRLIGDRPVLVFQGVLDTYIPPPISNPLAMSLDVRLRGRALDDALDFETAQADLALVERSRSGPSTQPSHNLRFLSQYPPDGIEDGHEILFQRPDAREQLRCFLQQLLEGDLEACFGG